MQSIRRGLSWILVAAGVAGAQAPPVVPVAGRNNASFVEYVCKDTTTSCLPELETDPAQRTCAAGVDCVAKRWCRGAWDYAFDWTVTGNKVVVTVHVALVKQSASITDAALAAQATTWKTEIETAWSERLNLVVTGFGATATIPVVLVADFGGGAGAAVVNVYAGTAPPNGRVDSGNWAMSMKVGFARHEFGHLIGAWDDYEGGFRIPLLVFAGPPPFEILSVRQSVMGVDLTPPLSWHLFPVRTAVQQLLKTFGVQVVDVSALSAPMDAPAAEDGGVDGPPGPGVCPVAPPAPVGCRFDTNDDGVPDLVLADADGNGRCEWPTAKTHLPGRLRFGANTPVEFRGTTLVEADSIVVEPAGLLVGTPDTLRTLTLVALAGTLDVAGTIDVGASDDLVITARTGDLTLGGDVRLRAADRIAVDARKGSLVVQRDFPSERLALAAGNRLELTARGANGRVRLVRARLGAPRVRIDARANVSVFGDKGVELLDGAALTTDPTDTGIPATGDLQVNAAGGVTVVASALTSSRNLLVTTQRTGERLCLSGGATLTARTPTGTAGRIALTAVRGDIYDDGSSIFDGTLLSPPMLPGVCP